MKPNIPVDPELQRNFEPLRVVFAITAVFLGLVLSAI